MCTYRYGRIHEKRSYIISYNMLGFKLKYSHKIYFERSPKISAFTSVQGNSHLNAGAYDVAIECYTRGMELDPTNPLLPANRAMALLKLQK